MVFLVSRPVIYQMIFNTKPKFSYVNSAFILHTLYRFFHTLWWANIMKIKNNNNRFRPSNVRAMIILWVNRTWALRKASDIWTESYKCLLILLTTVFGDVDHLLIYLLTICMSSLINVCLDPFDLVQFGLFVFLLLSWSLPCILHIWWIYSLQIFSSIL